MSKESLKELLWEGMTLLLKEVRLDEDERMRGLVQKEIKNQLEANMDTMDQGLQYVGVDVRSDSYQGRIIVAHFTSEDGAPELIDVSQWIHSYVRWTAL